MHHEAVSPLDIALRAASIALLVLIASVLLRDFRARTSARLGAALAGGTAIFALSSAAEFSSIVGQATVLGASLIAIASANIVVFWLFIRAAFDDVFEPGWRHLLIWGAVAGLSFGNCMLAGRSLNWPSHIGGAVLSVIALLFIALAVVQTIKTWSGDLVEGRRRLRVFVVTIAAAYGVVNAIVQLAAPPGPPSPAVSLAHAATLLAVVAAIAFALSRLAGEDLFAAEAPVRDATTEAAGEPVLADRKLADALTRLMAEERIYRQEGLSIGVLASKLGVPEYRLRRLINRQLGYRNFNAFLNGYRIDEARAALADPLQADVPVTTIALDAGFQSLGPFNRAFKGSTGLTPSEYRRMRLAATIA